MLFRFVMTIGTLQQIAFVAALAVPIAGLAADGDSEIYEHVGSILIYPDCRHDEPIQSDRHCQHGLSRQVKRIAGEILWEKLRADAAGEERSRPDIIDSSSPKAVVTDRLSIHLQISVRSRDMAPGGDGMGLISISITLLRLNAETIPTIPVSMSFRSDSDIQKRLHDLLRLVLAEPARKLRLAPR